MAYSSYNCSKACWRDAHQSINQSINHLKRKISYANGKTNPEYKNTVPKNNHKATQMMADLPTCKLRLGVLTTEGGGVESMLSFLASTPPFLLIRGHASYRSWPPLAALFPNNTFPSLKSSHTTTCCFLHLNLLGPPWLPCYDPTYILVI